MVPSRVQKEGRMGPPFSAVTPVLLNVTEDAEIWPGADNFGTLRRTLDSAIMLRNIDHQLYNGRG